MSISALPPPSSNRLFSGGRARFVILMLLALGLAAVSVLATEALWQMALMTTSAALLAVCVASFIVVYRDQQRRVKAVKELGAFIAHDELPSLATDADAVVINANASAQKRLNSASLQDLTLAGVLDKTLANPAETVARLGTAARKAGAAHEDVVTRQGRVRLLVHRTPGGFYLWRIADLPTASVAKDGPVPPMITVGRKDTVLRMNDAARQLLGRDPSSLDQIFDKPVAFGRSCNIDTPTGSVSVLVGVLGAAAEKRTIVLLPTDGETEEQNDWSFFQNLPVPLLKVNPNGHVQSFNLMAANMIGGLLNKDAHLSDFMEGLGRPITDWLQDTVAGRVLHPTEFLRLRRMDQEVFVQVTLNRVEENGVPSLIAVLNDATELKSLEAQFVQSQKMQAIGQLAGGVAHDFNNLLTAISGHCDLLLLRHDQGDPDFSDLVQINQNANRAAALVGQLLAFSRKQTLRPETLDMRDTLSDLTHLLNRLVGEKVSLTLNHDPVLRPIRADKRQLEQVLMNLVVNARDAMPNGGAIRIDTECVQLREPLNRDRVSVPAGEYVVVRVTDEGVGIPYDKLQKVFEPFFTTKRTGEGTGLGLSTAYGIVKQTGGYIFVDSTVGAGTCFSLYFPVLEAFDTPPEKSRGNLVKPAGKHGDGVILLVEDEAPVRAFASRALRLRGYTVLEADSAETALKTLQDSSLNVDVFVTDVVMPGMDGPSWVREALKDRPDVRVVFVSGYAEDSFGEAQMKIPNSVFLPKPFSLNDLTETVHKQLH